MELKKVTWGEGSGKKVAYFIKILSGYVRISIFESEFYDKFPKGAIIEELDIDMKGRVK